MECQERGKLGSLPVVLHFGSAAERSVVISYGLLADNEKLAATLAGIRFRAWALTLPNMFENGRPDGYIFVLDAEKNALTAAQEGRSEIEARVAGRMNHNLKGKGDLGHRERRRKFNGGAATRKSARGR